MVFVENVEIRFVSLLEWEGFGQYMLRCIFLSSTLAYVMFVQHILRYILSLAWDRFVQRMLRYIFCPRWHRRILVKTCWDAFYVLAGMRGFWSTHVDMHFLSSLWLIMIPHWHGMGFVNTCWDSFVCPCWYILCLFNTWWVPVWVLSSMG